MDKLLMLGTSSGSVEIIELAKSMGVYTITTDFLPPEKSAAKLISDEQWMISTDDLDALEKKCRETGVTSVITGISEFNIDQQIKLCKRLGLPCYCTEESWHYNRDKHDFKEACRKYGVPTAKQFFFSETPTDAELKAVQYPVVTKAPDQNANIGMSFCYNEEELLAGIAKAKEASFSGKYIVEKMLTGGQYCAFFAIADGQISLLNFYTSFSQPGKPTNCYSLNTTFTDCLDEYLAEMDEYVRKFVKGIGCKEGIVWLEVMSDTDDKLYVLEMGYRLTGELIWLPFRDITGFDSMKWMLNYALTGKNDPKDLPVSQTALPDRHGCSYILWTDREATISEIRGYDEISKLPGFYTRNLLSVGEKVDAYRYGIIICFTADNCEEICKTVDYINKTVQAFDENGQDMLIRYDQFDELYRLNEKLI